MNMPTINGKKAITFRISKEKRKRRKINYIFIN